MEINQLYASGLALVKARLPFMVIIVGRIGIALAGVITVKLSTVLLKPDQLGSISQLNSLVNLFNISLVIPVAHFMTRGFLDWYDSNQLSTNTKKYLGYVLVVSVASVLVSGAIQWQWNLVNGFGILSVMLLVGLNIIAQPINSFGTTGFNLFGFRKTNVFFTNLVAWTSLGCSILLFYVYRNTFSWSMGQVVGFMAGCFSFFLIWKKISNHSVVELPVHEHAIIFSRKAVFAFSWPFLFTSSLWWIQTQSYRFILEKIQGLSEVGLFATAYALAAMPIMLYESIITQYLEPSFFGELKNQGREGQIKAWNKYAYLYLPGIAIAGAYVAAATPFLAKIFLGKEYRSVAIQVTCWAAIIETMRAAGAMMFQLGMAKVDNRMTIFPAIAGAILAPLGVIYFGGMHPIAGTITGLFIAGLIVLLINVFLSYKVLPITWPVKRIVQALLLTMPVTFGLPVLHYFFPEPNYLVSFLALSVSALYIAGILAVLLAGQGKMHSTIS